MDVNPVAISPPVFTPPYTTEEILLTSVTLVTL